MVMAERVDRLMDRVYFGAELYKGLSEGKISKADAVGLIMRLSKQLNGSDATTLLRRIQSLVKR